MSVDIVRQIHQNHIDRKFYEIGDDQSIRSIKPTKCSNPFSTVDKILAAAVEASLEDARILHSCAYDYIRWIEKKDLVTEENQEQLYDLYATTLILLFGKEVTPTKIRALRDQIASNSAWYQFIKANHIHYAVHGQRLQFDDNIAGKININGTWVNFDDLVVRERDDGIDFLLGQNLVFKTDKNYKLQGYFYGGNKGVQTGDAVTANGMDDFFSREPSGKYWLSVYVSQKDNTQVQFGRSHSYLGLEDADGNFYYAGQYGTEKDVSVKDVSVADIVTPIGEKQMGIETPDRYTSLPLALHEIKEARIEITREQYEKLTESIRRDKEKGVKRSLIKGDCTEYVRKKLKLIGIQAKTTMTFQEFLVRLSLQVLPRKIDNKVVKFGESLPGWVKKVLHFNPILYPVIIVASASVTAFSGSLNSDFSICNAITRPWKIRVSHPIALSDSLGELEQEQKRYTILRAHQSSDSELAEAVGSATEKLGFRVDNEGKLLMNDRVHITQHQVRSLPGLVCGAIYGAISNKLSNWWGNKDEMDRNTMLLYLHTLMNQKFITPYQFYNLRQTIHDKEEFNEQVKDIVESLYKRKLIDRRSYIHLSEELKAGKINETLQYVISVSLLNGINNEHHFDAIQELMTPQVQMEVLNHLRGYQRQYSFNVAGVKAIQAFVSRVNCYEWAQKIDDEESKGEISEAIRNRNEEGFITAVRFYLSKQLNKERVSEVEKRIIKEMMHSVEFPKGESAFVNLANDLQTQARIAEVENELKILKDKIGSNLESISAKDVEDLQRLHQNIGVFLDSHIGYTGSATYMSLMIGRLRTEWEAIDNLLANRVMPSASDRDFWPDVGFREIKPVAVQEVGLEDAKDPVERKKVFFAYCSWGNGHKSVTSALVKGLGADYRVTACDIPDEILIERDPLFQALGPDHSITTLYNTLVAGNYWGAIDLIKQMGAAPTPEEEIEMQKDLIRRKLLQEKPDMVVVTYERHSDLLLEVAKELGIPFTQVYTDMVSHVGDHVKKAFKAGEDYPHQRILCPYPIPQMEACITESGIDEQYFDYMGFPVRKEFLQDYDVEELKSKYGVKPDQKVILCMNGGCGGDTPWPKLIAGAKKGQLSNVKLIVVCGNNKEFQEEVSKLKSIDPTIEIEARGYTLAPEMAEIAAITDLTITKPGGATVAENLLMQNYLLLDTRFSCSLPWEMDAAAALHESGLASSLESTDGFIELLSDALTKEVPDVPEFHQYDGKVEETFKANIDAMMETADEDGDMQTKREESVSLEHTYPMLDLLAPNRSNFEQNLASLLLLNEKINPNGIMPSLRSSLWEASEKGIFVKFNLATSKFEACSKLNIKDLEYAVDVVIREIKGKRDISEDDLERVIKLVIAAKEKDPKQTRQMLKRLAEIDFTSASKKASALKEQPTSLESMRGLFHTEEAFNELQSWVELKTSRSRRNTTKYGDERMINEEDLIAVFINYPEELKFVKELYLHRKASAFDHQFVVEDNHLKILFEGEYVPVSDLMSRFKIVNDRILSTTNDDEYTYTYNLGLSKIDIGQHPVHWQGEIPIFKKKDRKTKDYRLEVMSVTGKENHGWLRLKDPEGNVYSVGAFWDPDYQLGGIQRFDSLPGYIRGAGDLQEFLGQEEHWKRTKIVLDEAKFEQLKQRIIYEQKEGVNYNLINGNCVSLVSRLLKDIGVKQKLADSPLVVYTMPDAFKKFLIRHNQVRTIVEIVTYPLRLLQNMLLSCLGMWKKRDLDGLYESGFSKGYEFFTWKKGIVDHPTQLKLLQEVLEEDYGEEGTDKIHFTKFLETEKTGIVGSQVLAT